MARAPKVYQVDVFYSIDDGEGGDGKTWWSAEGGLAGESVGTNFESSPDLSELMDSVAEEVAEKRLRWPELTVAWTLDGGPADELFAAAKSEGVDLPN